MAERPSRRSLQELAIRGSLWTVLHTILSMPIAFVANVVVARVLGPGGYGSLALLTAALTAAMVVANFGFTSATVQWGAAAEAAGDRAETRRLLSRSSGFHLLVELPLLLLMGLALLRNEDLWLQLAFSGGLVLLMAVETAARPLQKRRSTPVWRAMPRSRSRTDCRWRGAPNRAPTSRVT